MRLAWQIDNLGNPNSLTLGMFLADPEVKELLRSCCATGPSSTASPKPHLQGGAQRVNGPNIPKAEATANSDNWVFAPPPASDDELDPPEGSASLFAVGGPSEKAVPKPPDALDTVCGGKRKPRAA